MRQACVLAIVLSTGLQAAEAIAAAPGAVGNTVRLSRDGASGETTIAWEPIADATGYDTYVGTLPDAPLGSRGPGSYEIVTASGGGGQFVACPGGKKVIGGGADGSAPLWSSRPEPPGSGWYASAGGPFVIAYAICADVDASYEIVSASGGGDQLATCPGSKKVLGGGADGDAHLWASRPEPPAIGWYASAGGPFVVSRAICAAIPYDHSCHGSGDALGDGATVSHLDVEPPVGTGFYILVSGKNASGEGSLGAGRSTDGSPIERLNSTACPAGP